MSDVNDGSANVNDQNGADSDPAGKEFVTRKAYEQVTADMHRFKASAKELAAAKSEYEAKLKSIEEEKMREQNQWKELFEREKQDKEAALKKSENDRNSYLTTVKKSALKAELGGRVKDVYLSHANISAIEFDEHGNINQESLLKVANDFRQNHGELLGPSSSSEPTSFASPTSQTLAEPQSKSVGEMSDAEYRQALAAAPAVMKK